LARDWPTTCLSSSETISWGVMFIVITCEGPAQWR
jgi:hypothetical protein